MPIHMLECDLKITKHLVSIKGPCDGVHRTVNVRPTNTGNNGRVEYAQKFVGSLL